jgi:hypothetical protein
MRQFEASGGIITSLLEKWLGDMEKRPTEKMESLDVQTAESTLHHRLIDALEEPVVAMSNQFCYCAQYQFVPEAF